MVAGGLQEPQGYLQTMLLVTMGALVEALTMLAALGQEDHHKHPVVQEVNALTSTAIQ